MDMMLEQFKTIFDRPEKVKKLRETILDLAVRGKLVEQDPNDEPTSVLLDRIKEEKERLIKEKKIKKEKSLAEISEDEIEYFIPKSWRWCKLPNVYSVYGNSSSKIKTNELEENGKIPVVSQGKELIVGYSNQVDKVVKLEGNSVVIFGDHTKEVKLVDFDFICGADGVKVLLPICCNIKYFYWFLKNVKIDSRDYGRNFKKLNEKLIPIPPLEEQKRIVEKVDSLMVFCDKLEKALEKKVHYGELAAKSVFNAVGNVSTVEELEETLRFILLNFKDLSLGDNAVKELKNCIIQLAVQGKLVPQDSNDEPAEVLLEKIREEKERLIKEKKIKKEKPLAEISDNPYIIPSRWSLVRLGTLAKGIEYGTSTKADLDQSKVPVLRMNNIIDGKIDYKNLKYVDSDIKDLPRLYLNNKDLLFNRTNSYELVGKTAVFKGLDNSMTFASYLIRIELFNEMVNAEYINIVMNSNLYRISQIEPEITQQNGQANFNGTKLKSTIIPLPPIEEQKRIVEKVDSLMILCDELEKKIQKQKDYSNRLMESILKSSL
ncbi:restriction endonuclease subunit S [Clostridium sp. D46t1_190503_E9]|uniref:restriction endonuclease subunit S n=1 Tax=Clostridium sp. D46t1_190503_E9 TaxID=2787137 RepID=UPI00189879A1|nr:restriction endonuclease subunit S [Clostridium sp. D46t1_190503_E9]